MIIQHNSEWLMFNILCISLNRQRNAKRKQPKEFCPIFQK